MAAGDWREPARAGKVTDCVCSEDSHMQRLPALAVISILTLLGSGCSRTEFAYRHADWLLEYQARRTVAANAEQRALWQPVLADTLAHHREEELPLVIAYLDLASRGIGKMDSAIDAACLVEATLLLYQRHARLAVDLSVPLLSALDAAQVRHLAGFMEQRQERAVKEYLKPDTGNRKAARQQRFVERIENWTGSLNEQQRQQVSDAVVHIPDLSAPWLAYRTQKTDTLLEMLETGTSATSLRAHINDWWVEMDGRSAEFNQQWQLAKQQFLLMLDELNVTLPGKQRTRLEQQLTALRSDLAPFLPAAQAPLYSQLVSLCAAPAV